MEDTQNNMSWGCLEGDNIELLNKIESEQHIDLQDHKKEESVSTIDVGTDPSFIKNNDENVKETESKISETDDRAEESLMENFEEDKSKLSMSTDTEEDKKHDDFTLTGLDENPKQKVDSSTDTEEDLNIQTSKMILSIEEEVIITLKLSITYFDNMIRTSYIKMGDIVKIHAIQPVGKLNIFEGLVKSITKNKDGHYLICLDCAHDYKSEIVYINTQSIRAVEKVIVPKIKEE